MYSFRQRYINRILKLINNEFGKTRSRIHVGSKLFKQLSPEEARNKRIRSTLYYVAAAGIVTTGMSYAAVPLYRMFCQAYGYGGTVTVGHVDSKVETMTPIRQRPITIKFNADIATSMKWNFKPQQGEITVI